MTIAIDAVASTQPSTSPRPVAAIIAEGDLFDVALAALVRGLGFTSVLIDLEVEPPAITADQHPVVSIVRSPKRVAQLRTRTYLRASTVIALVGPEESAPTIDDGLVGPDICMSTYCAPGELRRILVELFQGSHTDAPPPIHITHRELEVLTTYIMGSTMSATAKHYFIAESTVRAHYRRVSARYAAAGREVGNKAQLLLALVADGLISPRELLEQSRTAGTPPASPERPAHRRCG